MSFLGDDNKSLAPASEHKSSVAKGLRLPTEQIREQSIANKDTHKIAINSMTALDIAQYVTYDKEDDMIDYKRLREIKRACKDNDKLKARFKIAMQALAHNNEIDKDGAEVDSYRGVVDGLSL